MRTLKVEGRGEVTVTPDLCIYSISICKKNSEYSICYNELNNHSNRLRKLLIETGIAADKIKTSRFSVSAVTEYSQELNKALPDGYEGIQKASVEIPFKKELMNTVLNAISADCGDDLSISISFGVGDKETLRKQLICNSVAAARMNADIISDSGGIVLGQIILIEYGRNEESFGSYDRYDVPTFLRSKNNRSNNDALLSIVPEDISAEDTVTVVYEIL